MTSTAIIFPPSLKKFNFIGIFEKCGKFFAQMFDKSTLSLVRLHTQLLSSTNVFLSYFLIYFMGSVIGAFELSLES